MFIFFIWVMVIYVRFAYLAACKLPINRKEGKKDLFSTSGVVLRGCVMKSEGTLQ